jgi:hypothetical protein
MAQEIPFMWRLRRGFLFALALSVALAGCRKQVKPEDDDELAPEIQGKDTNGKKMTLSDYRGKVVLLVFWRSN